MPAKSVELSIVILSYNTFETTRNCISSIYRSLSHSALAYEIIVIDNASPDQSGTLLKKEFPAISLIQNTSNLGFAKANNQGVNESSGEYLLLLNSDTIIREDAIEKLLKIYKSRPDIHFLGPKLLNSDLSPQPSAAPFYSLFVVFSALFLKGDYWGLSRSSPDQFTRSDWISGACILTKKSFFDKLHGFDESIFMYMDEVDLLYRAHKLGMNTFFTPDAMVVHFGSGSSKGRTEPILQVYRGFLYFYQKHHSTRELYLLKYMLQLKAHIAYGIGKITQNSYLIKTYEKALKLVG